jgi:hypothetical protein
MPEPACFPFGSMPPAADIPPEQAAASLAICCHYTFLHKNRGAQCRLPPLAEIAGMARRH